MQIHRLLACTLAWAAAVPCLGFEPGDRAWLTQEPSREKAMVALRGSPAADGELIAEWRWDAYGAHADRVFQYAAEKAGWIEVRINPERTAWVRAECTADDKGFLAFLLDRILLMDEYAAGTGRFAGLLPLDRDKKLEQLAARDKDDLRAVRTISGCLTLHMSPRAIREAVRASAIDQRHKDALLAALGKDDAEAVAKLIPKLGESDVAGSDAAKRLAAIGPPAVDALLAGLRSPDRRVRYWTLVALCGTGDPRVVPPVAEAMRADRDDYVRSVAAYYLRRFPEATEALIAQLRVERNAEVAQWIARGLVEAGRREAADALAARAEDPNEKLRTYALEGAAKFQAAAAHELILKHAQSDPSPQVRSECVLLLGRLGRKDARTRAVLAAELDAAEPARVWHAVKALRQLSGNQFGYDPAKPPAENAAAIARWKQWCGQ